MIQEVKAMKKFLSIMIVSAMLVSAVSCSNVAIIDDTSGSETTTSGTASPETSTDPNPETAENVSEDQNGISEESEPSAENGSSDSTPSEYSIADYAGEWSMDGGAGLNLMYIDENGNCTSVSVLGEVSRSQATVTADGIARGDENMAYENGELVDSAGYHYTRSAAPLSGSDYIGVWTMDGGAGTNTMRIFSNGTWNTVYADGSSSNGTYTASDSEIVFNDEYGNTMTYESGNLVDQAGYAWIKSSAVPY